MTTKTVEQRYSVEEYLRIEDAAEIKHEYYDGKIVPMPGGTALHNEIVANVIAALKILTKRQEKRYKLYTSDMKIQIEAFNHFVYPDAVVVSEGPVYYQERKDIITNPLLIVEVLSPSTAEHDRRMKFDDYRTIPSFKEYVLVSQNRPRITTYFREAEDLWRTKDVMGMEASVSLRSIDSELSLLDVYEEVEFEAGGES